MSGSSASDSTYTAATKLGMREYDKMIPDQTPYSKVALMKNVLSKS